MQKQIPKVKRVCIHIGDLTVETFQLPDHSYIMSQLQVAQAVHVTQGAVSLWLKKHGTNINQIIALTDSKAYIKGLSIIDAIRFWQFQAKRNNTKAQNLIKACMSQAITQ